MKKYIPKNIESKWQRYWQEKEIYKADLQSQKPKYISMSMFNYPSGAGIHIGHAMNYTISDVLARFKRQQGYESYHPVGWDSFGLPAENFAIKSGVSPQESMAKIIPNYHKQYQAMGWSNDWSKEIATHTPEYYKWTQWIFSEMYRAGLAYQDTRLQWWCDKCQTVLANEQIINAKCWRHDSPEDVEVQQREVKQWFFKITSYADELLEATDSLDWTETVKTAQKNWIGKSTGALIKFRLVIPEATSHRELSGIDPDSLDSGSEAGMTEGDSVEVFTTRPDTLFGATFLVLAPEHELVSSITTAEQKIEVENYRKEVARKTELERQADKEKTGVFTGSFAINPANGEEIPVWIAEYVLSGYGTSAIMAVPAHDERDFEFAVKFKLPIKYVVAPYYLFSGVNAPRDDVETLTREVIDAVIENDKGEFLLIKETNNGIVNVHLVGGGTDGEDELVALKREIVEETGFTDIVVVKKINEGVYAFGFRHTKNKNQFTFGPGYYVRLKSDTRIHSEADEGRHEIFWVSKDEVADLLTWPHHLQIWNDFLNPPSAFTGMGKLINSAEFNSLGTAEAIAKLGAEFGKITTQYKMRDWSVSRQRYWGAPIPIIYCESCGPQLVPDTDLPVVLPELKDFSPSGDGRSALARATDWVKVSCPKCGGAGERETDTLDTYICSSWYMMRYMDPHNSEQVFDSAIVNRWMPVDFYNGADHATAHMLYARFVTRFFHKRGLINNPEPFKKFLFNGKVTAQDGQMFSKSKGNGVDPLEIIPEYGADALRVYLMFAAPLELWIRWDPQGVPAALRFLNRIWFLVQEFIADAESGNDNETITRATHKVIKKVTTDLEGQKYNTAIASMMEFLNTLYAEKAQNGFLGSSAWRFAIESLVQLLAPFAPHIADELWETLGHADSIQKDHWPKWDDNMVRDETVTVVVQVNGKVKEKLQVATGSSEDIVKQAALESEKIKAALGGSEIKRAIFVQDKLLNLVV